MKKVLFFFALMGGLIAANAQNVKFVYNGTEYAAEESIPVMLYESDYYDFEGVLMVILQVKNLSDEQINVDITATIEEGEGYEVESFCSTYCQEGGTCPAFNIDANATSENVFPEFRLEPNHMNAQGTARAKLAVRNTANGQVINNTYLNLTYENPLAISSVEKMRVKVYPNPTTSMLNISSENADEIVISDLAGREVMRQRVEGANTTIHVEGLNGMYILNTVKGGQVNGSQKVMIR